LLEPVSLHFSIQEFLAIENERMIPQQAASTVTNVDDIEAYITSKESKEKTYLSAIDLPLQERRLVLQELSFMGITAGSLFPGLDGACEELKQAISNCKRIPERTSHWRHQENCAESLDIWEAESDRHRDFCKSSA
jgi:hypothetical protein